MKYLALFILTLYVLLGLGKCSKESQVLLSNKEIREILKCFGDLNLEEGCVICRYITQKIYKVLDISSMCPDIVETKLKYERERNWNPDPQMINKWTVLFNLQKDYLNRIKPTLDGVKNYNQIFNQKIKNQKIEKENLSNLIQFQNKINSDLAARDLLKNNKFDSDEKKCDDEELKYKSNKIVAPLKVKQTIKIADQPNINQFNKKLLLSLKAHSPKGSSFIETPESVYSNITANMAEKNNRFRKTLTGEDKENILLINNNITKNNGKNLNNLIKFNKNDNIYTENEKLLRHDMKKKIDDINETINIKDLIKTEIISKSNENKSKKTNLNKSNNLESTSKYSSFLEMQDNIRFDKNLFETLIKKSENYNLETQRRGRRRSRFPDPQWDCAESQIAKIVRYLCEEEVSSNYQKYCKPIFEQINTMIESYLYHDNNLEICQNLHMCPVSVDI